MRVVRGGSSYAEIDLGAGARHVFTRPGDILLGLGDRPSLFAIEEGRDLTFVQANPEFIEDMLAILGAALADLAPLADRPFRDPLVAELCVRLEAQPTSPMVRSWALGLILSLLLDAARRRRASVEKVRLTARRLAKIDAAIEAGLDGAITVAGLAAIAGLRDRTFSQAFREATGVPVYQYVLQRRVDRAIELLRTTDLSIAEIAQRAGFTHQSHLTRVMKQLKGRTPKQLRQ